MTRYVLGFTAGLTALFFSASPVWAQTVGNAQSFAIVGGQAINANGAGSIVNGDVGISPAAATLITGFPGFPPNQTGAIVTPPFAVRGHDGTAIAAEASADALYNSAAMDTTTGVITVITPNLSTGGPTANGHYVPGKYFMSVGTAILPTTMTLDGAGTYIFTLNSDLTTSVGSTIILNGVDPCTVWWRVPTQATLNGASFAGNVVSNALIAIGSGATVVGRALTTAAGSVTLAGNDVIGGCSVAVAAPVPIPACTTTAPDLFIVKHHAEPFVASVNGTYSIALFNTGKASSGPITVTDTLPQGLTFVSASGVGWTCGSNGPVVTCATTASVPAGSPYPNNITLIAKPGPGNVPTMTNTAVVAGGGDCDTTNNTTADITVVLPAVPVPTLSEWAFILLAMLLASAGLVALRRRSAA